MVTYLLQMIACSGVLWGYYYFVLRNEKFHAYNRFYLLLATIVSLLLPLIKIPVWAEATNHPLSGFVSTGENLVVRTTTYRHPDYTLLPYFLYTAVALFFIIRLILALKRIWKIRHEEESERLQHIVFIKTSDPDAPFSFFNWLFWNRKTAVQSEEGKHIFRHELYHIRNRHSFDLVFMEIGQSLFWLNPFFYLYKKEITTIQEFLADRYASKGTDANVYAQILLLQAIKVKQQKLINPFFHNQLKRRITMLTSSQKPHHQWLKKLIVLPVAAILIILFGFTIKKEIKEIVTTIPEIPSHIIKPLKSDEKTDESKVNHPVKTLDTLPQKVSKEKVISTEYVTGDEKYRRLNPITVVSFSNDSEKRILKEGETKVDVEAAYKGNWAGFLERNIDAQVATENGAPLGIYEAVVKFIVNEDGSLSNFTPATNEGFGMEEEVIRVLKKSGNWAPAINNEGGGKAKPVKSYRMQPVIFQVLGKNISTREVFTQVEVDASYPGNWHSFLERNLNARVPVDNGAPAGAFTTITQFIVDISGNVSDVKALTKFGYGMEEEAIRIINRSGKWKPAIQNGREVTAYHKQPITFQITEE